MKSWLFLSPILAFALLCAGCVSLPASTQLNVEIHNYTSQKLSDVEAWFGENKCRVGILIPGVFKVHVFYAYPITEHARVVWKDLDGKSHEVLVDLSKVYKRGQSGVLELGITDLGVVPKLKPLPPVP